jgi:hypothetical protein
MTPFERKILNTYAPMSEADIKTTAKQLVEKLRNYEAGSIEFSITLTQIELASYVLDDKEKRKFNPRKLN